MAVPDAVRRSGSLLVRALTVGGLATAAWLVCAGFASAGEDHSDEAAKTLDAVNMALGEQQAATADLLAGALTLPPLQFATFDRTPPNVHEPHPFEQPLAYCTVVTAPLLFPTADQTSFSESAYSDDGYHAGGPSADDTEYGYTYSGSSRSGSVSNTMPAPLYEAKVAARAAAAAALEPPAPAPTPVAVSPTTPPLSTVLPLAWDLSSPTSQITPNAEVVWEVPKPSAPVPAPKQVPAPSAPTASSSSADGGGGHRGGLIASFTARSDPKPSAAWSTERQDDGRSPGSMPGLPSTSPD